MWYFNTSPMVADGDGWLDGREIASVNGDRTVNAIDRSALMVRSETGMSDSAGGPDDRECCRSGYPFYRLHPSNPRWPARWRSGEAAGENALLDV